jgi:hypothetical protein
MALFTTTLDLYGGVLWSGELQGFIIHERMPNNTDQVSAAAQPCQTNKNKQMRLRLRLRLQRLEAVWLGMTFQGAARALGTTGTPTPFSLRLWSVLLCGVFVFIFVCLCLAFRIAYYQRAPQAHCALRHLLLATWHMPLLLH